MHAQSALPLLLALPFLAPGPLLPAAAGPAPVPDAAEPSPANGLPHPGPPAAASAAPQTDTAEEPPRGRALEDLLEALYAVPAHTPDTRADRDALLAPYAHLPAPTGSDRKKLLKEIEDAWEDGRELPTQGGEHWYWEDEKRGRFFVAGKTRRPKALFIGLHGGGEGSADASGAASAYQSAASRRGWAAVFPQAIEATERGWTDAGTEEWVLTLVDEARRTFGVPADRVYVGGHSMGGYGSWVYAAHHADVFAAAVPSAGAPTPILKRGTDEIVDLQEGVIPNLRNVPMCVFQSTDDPRVPPDVNQFAVQRIEEARERWGGFRDFTYWEVGDRGHGYPKGGTDALLERIESFERDAHPDHVVWQPALGWKTRFYWLDWAKPRKNAIVEARLDRKANRIDVDVNRGAGELAVLLSDDIVDMDREVVITLKGEEVYRGVPATSWATFVATALANDPGRVYAARVALDD